MHLVHERALDERPAVQPRVHAQALHALELRVVHLVEMRERPAQALDRLDPVDRFELGEIGIDRVFHLDVGVQEHAALGNRIRDAAHFAHVLGLDDPVVPQQVGRSGLIEGLAPADVVESVVALERRVLMNFGDHLVHFRGRRGLADRGPERARVQLAAIGEDLVGLVVLLAHAASAGVVPGGDAHRVQLGDELASVREPLLSVRQRNLRRDEGDAARAAHDPGRQAA